MRRREFIRLVGGIAAIPFGARAQQGERTRRIGVLMNLAKEDPEAQARVAAFLQGLQQLGWAAGRNVLIDTRWAGGDIERVRKYAVELVDLAPDVILAPSDSVVVPVQHATRTVPIVFTQVIDPVSSGLVESLARPGGNATGFTQFEYSIGAKWLELLKEVAPRVMRVAVLRDSTNSAEIGQLGAIQTAAPSLGVELSPVGLRDANEIERAVTSFARTPNGGLIVTSSTAAAVHRELIVTLAGRHHLPAVYSNRTFVVSGGLISYGPDRIDQFRRAADYVDRILKGEKPADMPVQAPTKYELMINLKAAKALGITVPQSVLARADELIESRRDFIKAIAASAAAWPLTARAQQSPSTIRRIGILLPESKSAAEARGLLEAFRQGLKEMGWVEGQNIAFEYRSADNKEDALPKIAVGLVQLRLDAILAEGTAAIQAAKDATQSIPIVMASSNDPVASRLIATLNQPGGNVTGLSLQSSELAGKRVQLLTEIVAKLARLAVLSNPTNPSHALAVQQMRSAAQSFGVGFAVVEASAPDKFDSAFATITTLGADSLVVLPDGMFFGQHRRLVELTAASHLPALFPEREVVEAGGLIAYGPSLPASFRRAAAYIDKILRGTKPGDIPVEQPTKFELVINLTTAKALGLTVPPALQARADEMIE